MPFNPESASKAGKKSKRGPIKKPPVKTKMAQLFEDLIQDLIKSKEKLSIQQKIRLVQMLSNYIVPKTKTVNDDFSLESNKIDKIEVFVEKSKSSDDPLD